MILGQRVCWLVPGKTGTVTAFNELKQTVDIRFEDGSERGGVPVLEVVSIQQGTSEPPTIGKEQRNKPSSIDSQERFGRPGLG